MTAGTPQDPGTAAAAGTAGPDATQPTRFGAVLRYFLRLGTSGFGGPIAVVG